MAQQPVDIGVSPNDGLGDDFRAAMTKLNANDAELYTLAPVVASQPTVDAGSNNTEFITPLTLESSNRFNEFKHPLSTGFEGTPPILTINGDNTKFDMSAGVIVHVDSSTHPVTVVQVVVAEQLAVTPTFLATETASFISIDVNGAIVQRASRSTAEQRRDYATVGLISHVDNVIVDAVVNTPTQNIDVASQAHDLMRALGFFSTSGNQISGITSTLTLQKSSGTGFALNENASINPKNPHDVVNAVLNPAVLVQILRDGIPFAISATIDPTIYDLAGVSTTVPANNNSTISYVYLFPNNSVVYLIGQEVFSTFAAAKDAAGTESVTVPGDLASGALLLARVVLKKNATDMLDPTEAFILPSANIAAGGSSISSLQQAYDISVSPEILTDATRGAFTVQNGDVDDTARVFEGENIAGDVTFCVTGDGDLLAHTIDITHEALTPDDHALEISADAGGFGDVKALDIVYTTGPIAQGQAEAIILVNIDETLATGGDIVGLEVIATEGAAGKVCGMLVGAGVGPIEQLTGAFADFDSIDDNGTDVTTELSTGGAGNIAAFTLDNETFTIGLAAKFEEIEFILDTVSSHNINATFEYSTGVGTWGTFTPTDGTNGMQNTGVVLWLDGDIPSWAVGTGSEYLIRLTRTRNSVPTPPILDLVKGAGVTEYTWSKDGNLNVNDVYANGDLIVNPSASITPTVNGELTFEATSNTSLTIKFKGSDGTVRTNVLTLS